MLHLPNPYQSTILIKMSHYYIYICDDTWWFGQQIDEKLYSVLSTLY